MSKQIDLSGSAFPNPREAFFNHGLTKRELFAAMALQGFMTKKHGQQEATVARWAVAYADSLLAELARKPPAE